MRGFTGDFYKGVPVFERSEYEAAHMHESEMERLGDCLGVHFYDEIQAYEYARANNEKLLYRRSSFIVDARLRGNADWKMMWEPYRFGYVHVVTGEYVKGLKPEYDSYPCWCIKVPATYWTSEQDVQYMIRQNLDNVSLGIAYILGII